MSETLILQWLADKSGRGRKDDFTPDQKLKIAALSQESAEQNGFPVTHWSAKRLAQAAIRRGIVNAISERTVHRILKKTTCLRTGADIGSMQK
jgi:putative transposase